MLVNETSPYPALQLLDRLLEFDRPVLAIVKAFNCYNLFLWALALGSLGTPYLKSIRHRERCPKGHLIYRDGAARVKIFGDTRPNAFLVGK